jgi:hypothetical protein
MAVEQGMMVVASLSGVMRSTQRDHWQIPGGKEILRIVVDGDATGARDLGARRAF